MPEQLPHLTIQKQNAVNIVSFSDRKILEELSIREIEDELFELVSTTPAIRLLLDFSNVQHLSSAALGMLIKLQKEVSTRDGQLKLSNINPQIYEVFKITRLTKQFEIHDTAAGAISAF
jgi:anti-sigma B factor antagonist